jgi:hypothetical protein
VPDDPAPRGPDHLILTERLLTERLRFLACEFEIRSNSADFMARLGYVAQRAEQDFPLEERCTIDVMWTGEEYRISDASGEAELELSALIALEVLYERMHRRALGRLREHIRIHAASGVTPHGVFLIVGPKRAGKTTLALRLIAEGYDITGDELVLLRDGQAVAFPRKFYVREGSMDLLPNVKALRASAPFVANPTEGRLIAVDPTRFDRPWRISAAPIAAILFIEPNHGARTTIVPCRKVDMVRLVVAECAPPASGRPGWLADLCRAVDHAETVIIRLGELESAVFAIAQVLCNG